MRNANAIRGVVIVLTILSMVGCGNREEYSNKTLVINQSVTNVVEAEPSVTISQISNKVEDEKPIDYSFIAGDSKFISFAKEAGSYLEDTASFAFEDDFDRNGKSEAFVILGVQEGNQITGDVWFVNYLNKPTLLLEAVTVDETQQLYRGDKEKYLLLTYRRDNEMKTNLYYVFEDWTSSAYDEEQHPSIYQKKFSQGNLIMMQSLADNIYNFNTENFTGETKKEYTYVYMGDHFENIFSEEKTREDFNSYANSDVIIEELTKEYHPTEYQFISRQDGLWIINMALEGDDNITFNYASYTVTKENALELVERGNGYYLLDMTSTARDFKDLILNRRDNSNLKTWLEMAADAGMSNEEAMKWYNRFQEDNIFLNNGYIGSGLQFIDADGNGEKDVFLLTMEDYNSFNKLKDPEFYSYFYVYMNSDPVYNVKQDFEKGSVYHFWQQNIVTGDFDQDGFIEIAYNICTGGNGGAGSSDKGVLKYHNHELSKIKLPNDLDNDFGDVGLQVQVLAGEKENSFAAYCPYVEQTVEFNGPKYRLESDVITAKPQEGENVGGNVRGYCSMEVVRSEGRDYLLLEEFLHGEIGINDGVGLAQFLVEWNSDGESRVIEFTMQELE